MKRIFILLILASVLINLSYQKKNVRNKIGEACKKKADCAKGLRCKKNKCIERKTAKPKDWRRCPPGWIEYQNECYLISKFEKTWSEANRICRSEGGQLLMIDSDIILDFSADFFNKFNLKNSYFIGAKFTYGWKWLDGSHIQPQGYMWSKCAGSNSFVNGDCLSLDQNGLDSCSCNARKRFICGKSFRRQSISRKNSCFSNSHCKRELVCHNNECICPIQSFITLNKCSSPSSTNLLVNVGSNPGLEFFTSKLQFTWIDALKESANFNIDLLMLKTYDQMVKFIDFAIKNQLSGPYWIGAFAVDKKLTWIDESSLPRGPWLPSFNGCDNYEIGQGLVCFALDNYQIVPRNCDQQYPALIVQGISLDKVRLQSLIERLSQFVPGPQPTTPEPEEHDEWNYKDKGPDYWAQTFENCRGTSQSPINIIPSTATFQSSLKRFFFRNYRRSLSWNVVNNGHSISASPVDGQANKPSITGSDFNERYYLLNFHFHWGYNIYQGSEHLLNGKKFPLEVHLVHQSNSGKIAVLGFFFEITAQNNTNLNEIISVANINDKKDTRLITYSLLSMIPKPRLLNRAYFRYSGSFTTPPCTEGVTWTVFRAKIPISEAQVKAFYQSGIDINFREVQPINARALTTNIRN